MVFFYNRHAYSQVTAVAANELERGLGSGKVLRCNLVLVVLNEAMHAHGVTGCYAFRYR